MKYPLAKLALPLLLMTTLLTSCTAMTKRECLGGEWHSAGEEDALAAEPKIATRLTPGPAQSMALWLTSHSTIPDTNKDYRVTAATTMAYKQDGKPAIIVVFVRWHQKRISCTATSKD